MFDAITAFFELITQVVTGDLPKFISRHFDPRGEPIIIVGFLWNILILLIIFVAAYYIVVKW